MKGDAAVLLLDEENKVTDVSFVPDQHKETTPHVRTDLGVTSVTPRSLVGFWCISKSGTRIAGESPAILRVRHDGFHMLSHHSMASPSITASLDTTVIFSGRQIDISWRS